MYYKESKKILKEIKKAKRILITCHKNPDADSIGSSTALCQIVMEFGKKVSLVCEDRVPENLRFIPGLKTFRKHRFPNNNFSKYDLLIVLDTAGWYMVTHTKYHKGPSIFSIVIDHHKTNSGFGDINLVNEKASSTCEILYGVYVDWKVEIKKDVAQSLLTGIMGDTGSLRYPNATPNTIKIASCLMDKGADKNLIVYNLERQVDADSLKILGKTLSNIKLDKHNRFVWSVLRMAEYKKYIKNINALNVSLSAFSSSVKGTDFGIVMVEEENGLVVELRSRKSFDTSVLAEDLGGGGHVLASGAKIKGLTFDKAVEKVLTVARRYAEKHSKKVS